VCVHTHVAQLLDSRFRVIDLHSLARRRLARSAPSSNGSAQSRRALPPAGERAAVPWCDHAACTVLIVHVAPAYARQMSALRDADVVADVRFGWRCCVTVTHVRASRC
jgi:hypothetical protein